jgi:hypothetical protein
LVGSQSRDRIPFERWGVSSDVTLLDDTAHRGCNAPPR